MTCPPFSLMARRCFGINPIIGQVPVVIAVSCGQLRDPGAGGRTRHRGAGLVLQQWIVTCCAERLDVGRPAFQSNGTAAAGASVGAGTAGRAAAGESLQQTSSEQASSSTPQTIAAAAYRWHGG